MKKMTKVLVIVLCAVVLIVAAVVVLLMSKDKNTVKPDPANIKDVGENRLEEFIYSSGGGMEGGHYSITVKAYDDTRAIISIENQSWHSAAVEVDECLVDIQIMADIEAVFRKYKMEEWNQMKFTDEFVYDGESYSYYFKFNGFNIVSFSSQIYPEKYRNKLNEFDDIISKYKENGEKLPGLFHLKKNEEEEFNERVKRLESGELTLVINEYSLGKLYFCVTNGMEESVNYYEDTYKLFKEGESEPLLTHVAEWEASISPREEREDALEGVIWLEPGKYYLEMGQDGELKCEFVIE